MNRKYFLPVIVLSSFALFSCKKSSTSDSTDTTTTPILEATIGGSTWTPDTVSASIVYNTTSKTKTFSFKGTKDQKQVEASIKDSSPADNGNFTAGTYTANGNNIFIYSTQVKNSDGVYVFQPYGTVLAGNGSLTVSAIDTVAKTITGTYYFTASKSNYDSNGGLISIDLAGISGGTFNKMPYKLERQ